MAHAQAQALSCHAHTACTVPSPLDKSSDGYINKHQGFPIQVLSKTAIAHLCIDQRLPSEFALTSRQRNRECKLSPTDGGGSHLQRATGSHQSKWPCVKWICELPWARDSCNVVGVLMLPWALRNMVAFPGLQGSPRAEGKKQELRNCAGCLQGSGRFLATLNDCTVEEGYCPTLSPQHVCKFLVSTETLSLDKLSTPSWSRLGTNHEPPRNSCLGNKGSRTGAG